MTGYRPLKILVISTPMNQLSRGPLGRILFTVIGVTLLRLQIKVCKIFWLLINFIIKKQAIFSINTYCLPLNTICFLIFSKEKSCDKENELSSVTLCGLQSLSLTKEAETDRAELITKHYSHSKCLFHFLVINLSVTICYRRNMKYRCYTDSLRLFESPLVQNSFNFQNNRKLPFLLHSFNAVHCHLSATLSLKIPI